MEKIRFSLDLTPEVNALLENAAKENGVTKGEILRKALAIFIAAKEEKQTHNLKLGFFDSDRNVVSEIIVT